MNLADLKNAFGEDAEISVRCTFCNGQEESEGSLGMEIQPGEFMELPIGPKCLAQVQGNFQWVDKPE